MNDAEKTMVDEIAQLAIACQAARTGHTPTSAAVGLSDDTLVITLHEALSTAERALAKSAAGATQVQEFHRQLFLNSIAKLRTEIKRITGREVCEAAAEIEATTGTVVHAFTTGNVVQVFSLNQRVDLRLPDLPPTAEVSVPPRRIPSEEDAVEGRSL